MKTPFIRRSRAAHRHHERGVTMVFVALAMVAIIAMAALSIDVITLYLAKQEAQRSADSAALAAAKVLSVSGITGDPNNGTSNWGVICGPDDGTNGLATRMAKAVANQTAIAGGPVTTTPTVTYSSGGANSADCTALSGTGFGVNPIVSVQLTRGSLPTFFSRIWGNTGNTVSATATAEVFNPSNSGNSGNQITGTTVPVQPRCVKPWVVPNQDPLHNTSGGLGTCTGGGNCAKIVNLTDGSIVTKGISLNGTGNGGIIGETFWLVPDCRFSNQSTCILRLPSPKANAAASAHIQGPPNLMYVPGQVGTPVTAVPSCTESDPFEVAIEGCDAPTNYTCGLPPGNGGTNAVNLSRNPEDATTDGVSCLIHQTGPGNISGSTGQDYLNPFMLPSSYPFQILAGSSNPVVSAGLTRGSPISTSPSVVSLPIYDETDPGVTLANGTSTNVTFVGFLQVFINVVDQFGNVNVTVLNVAGCGNGSGTPVGTPLVANSPVPVRLITPP
jgi:Flp pilus assembly protein TadG